MAGESKLEAKCRQYVMSRGGRMPKWIAPGDWGVQDRIVLLPHCPVVFVEFKNPNKKGKKEPAQRRWADWLDNRGFKVWRNIDNYEEFVERVDDFIQWERHGTHQRPTKGRGLVGGSD